MPLRILHLEDSPADAELVHAMLEAGGIDCEIVRADTASSFASALETGSFNLILADFALPSFGGIEGLELARKVCPEIPFLFVSGSMGEEVAIETLKKGATDYVLKNRLARLVPAIERALEESRTRERRQEAEEALRASEARYRLLFENNPQPMWVFDSETLAFLAVNSAACHHYGYSRDEFLGMTIRDIRPPEDVPELFSGLATEPREYQPARVWKHRVKDGTEIDVEIHSHPLVFDEREAQLVLAVDVTQRTQLEQQLRQSQKIEAIGQLAGGVAHDFNNVLTVILGHCELLLKELKADDRVREDIVEIQVAGERAATLTRQLLAFSRKQLLEPVVLDLNEIVRGLEKMLRRLIPEDIIIRTSLATGSPRILADPGQLEQIIMNLVVNARDAMAEGGHITIETTRVEFDAGYTALHSYATPGPQVMLAVSDTGSGMSRDTQARIFEPFFTTKAQGSGTGLGLSTVYGIVKQSGGSIEVYSEPGQGTVFKIYFSEVADEITARRPSDREPVGPVRGSETILLVEDEDGLRVLARRALEMYGYTVLEGPSAESAMQVSEGHEGAIHLLLTDTVMPGRSGPELARILLTERPEMKVLYMSGYTSEGILRRGPLERAMDFLQKPFTPDALVARVRGVLDAPGVGVTPEATPRR